MADKTKLGDRMKLNYELRAKQFLTRRTNTIIRLDGKAFHTYTKGLKRPFDEGLIEDMQETAKYLCENIQGVKAAYTQSDEITLILTDYDNLETSAWYDGNVQKIVSVSSSIATAKFNQLRLIRSIDFTQVDSMENLPEEVYIEDIEQKLAFFDSRVFQIPEKEEVVNCLLWRQKDAERNSIQMLARSLYSHKEVNNKNTSQLQDMCWEKGHNWNDLHFSKKRGSLILKNKYCNNKLVDSYTEINEDDTIRTKWEVVETPIFSQDRNIILNLLK